MKLTQELLDVVVARVVPEKYRPSGSEEGKDNQFLSDNPQAVTNISVISRKEFNKRTKFWCPDAGPSLAITINWGRLQQFAKVDGWEKYLNSSAIFFNEDFGTLSGLKLEFVVLHEIGHVDQGFLKGNEAKLWKNDSEAYADYYAAQRLIEIYDNETAKTMLKVFGTSWQARKRRMDA